MSLVLVSVRMRITLVALLALLILCVVPGESEASHGYNNIHWRATGAWPLTVTLHNSLSGSAPAGSLSHPVGDWNAGQSRIRWATTTTSNTATTRQACADPSGSNNLRVCDYDWGATGWAGRATWDFCDYARTQHVCAGGVRVNRHYGTSYGFYRLVLCHELGHYLALNHRSSGSSCMRTGVPVETQYQRPDAHDYDQAVAQHDHRHAAPSITSLNKEFLAGRITVNWTGLSTDSYYKVYRSINGGSWQLQTNTPDRSWSDHPPATNLNYTYCYRVLAWATEGGESPYSNGRCVVWGPDDLPEPAAPSAPSDPGDDVTGDGPAPL